MGESLVCYQCGYDLRAQPADGVCPECGALVAASQAAVRRQPLLVARWATVGCAVIAFSGLAMVGTVGCWTTSTVPGPPPKGLLAFYFVISLAVLLGPLLLFKPLPGEGMMSRRWMLGMLLAAMVVRVVPMWSAYAENLLERPASLPAWAFDPLVFATCNHATVAVITLVGWWRLTMISAALGRWKLRIWAGVVGAVCLLATLEPLPHFVVGRFARGGDTPMLASPGLWGELASASVSPTDRPLQAVVEAVSASPEEGWLLSLIATPMAFGVLISAMLMFEAQARPLSRDAAAATTAP